MSVPAKLKIRQKNGHAQVLVLIQHPMESGLRTDKTGRRIPAHFIETVHFELNGAAAAEALLGPDVAANPLVSIMLKNAGRGDLVKVSWIDNQGQSGTASTAIS